MVPREQLNAFFDTSIHQERPFVHRGAPHVPQGAVGRGHQRVCARARTEMTSAEEREHVTPWFYTNPARVQGHPIASQQAGSRPRP